MERWYILSADVTGHFSSTPTIQLLRGEAPFREDALGAAVAFGTLDAALDRCRRLNSDPAVVCRYFPAREGELGLFGLKKE